MTQVFSLLSRISFLNAPLNVCSLVLLLCTNLFVQWSQSAKTLVVSLACRWRPPELEIQRQHSTGVHWMSLVTDTTDPWYGVESTTSAHNNPQAAKNQLTNFAGTVFLREPLLFRYQMRRESLKTRANLCGRRETGSAAPHRMVSSASFFAQQHVFLHKWCHRMCT